MNLNNTGIIELHFNDCSNQRLFPRLRSLALNQNRIGDVVALRLKAQKLCFFDILFVFEVAIDERIEQTAQLGGASYAFQPTQRLGSSHERTPASDRSNRASEDVQPH